MEEKIKAALGVPSSDVALAPAPTEAVEVVKVIPPAMQQVVSVAKKYDFSEYLKPGEDRSETPGFTPGRAQPTGHCEGVIYIKTDKTLPKEVYQSKFKPALRYLAPQTLEWLAENPGYVGRCTPEIMPLLKRFPERYAEMLEECKRPGRELAWMFKYTREAAKCCLPQNINRWQIVKAEEGIWCVIWV